MKANLLMAAFALALAATGGAQAQSTAGDPVPVTPDNFIRAETDLAFGSTVKDGGLGKFVQHGEPPPLDFPIVRPNRDTLYSLALFDLTLPDAGRRFMSMQVSGLLRRRHGPPKTAAASSPGRNWSSRPQPQRGRAGPSLSGHGGSRCCSRRLGALRPAPCP
jgi:hypothetical protein